MITLKNIYKKYNDKLDSYNLYNISLDIKEKDIFGIIGFSGAGKSTLLRTINFLEKPSKGEVIIDGVEFSKLDKTSLARYRKNIGIVFQNFNLLYSKNIYKNIALPLEINKEPKKVIKARVNEVAKLVGLDNYLKKYPHDISGGQKQRIGIARAITTYPKILLCDEATSALDPVTTLSILNLLKNINKTLGLTIVLVTHEMHVVKTICNRMAVIDNGKIIESGNVQNVFSSPNHSITKLLLNFNENSNKYDYSININLSKGCTNLEFLTLLAKYSEINISRSNITHKNGRIVGDISIKLKLHNMNIEIIKNLLIQQNLVDFNITQSNY